MPCCRNTRRRERLNGRNAVVEVPAELGGGCCACGKGGPKVVLVTTEDLRAVWWWSHRPTMSGFFEKAWRKGWDRIEERRRELREQDSRRTHPPERGWTQADQAKFDESSP